MGRIGHHSDAQLDQPLDAAVGALATRQWGVLSRQQLTELGLGRGAIARRLENGRLHVVHRGVYAVGHRSLRVEGHYLAAVLACGPGAALSHRSAGDLTGVRRTGRLRVDVSVPTRAGRARPGIDVHRTRLHPEDVTRMHAIPCTTVARTLVDLADLIPPHALRRAINEAEINRDFDLAQTRAAIARANGRKGAASLAALLDDLHGIEQPTTRSDLEAAFAEIARRAGLPPPLFNAAIELIGRTIEPDVLWPRHRLIVEIDGWQTHGTRNAFEDDRRRDADLLVTGYRVLRFTWRQITREPDWVAETVIAALSDR